MRPWSRWLPVVALTVLGAALRFPTLDRQSFWLDELVTVSLLDRGLGDVLREIPRTEATPFAYYVVAWVWSSVFGLGEVGLRSLSALAGTATIPVAYGAGAVLVSRRAGLVAAALVATNPFLVWYSQEARSYALLALARRGIGARLRPRAPRRRAAGSPAGRPCRRSRSRRTTSPSSWSRRRRVWLLVRLRPRRPAVVASLFPAAAAPRPRPARARPARQRRGGRRFVPRRHGSPGSRRTSPSATASRPRRSGARSPRCSSSSASLLVARLAHARASRRARRGLARPRRDPDRRSCSPSRAPTTSSRGTRSPPSSRRRCASEPDTRQGGSASRRRPCSASSRPPWRWPRRSTRAYGRTDWRGAAEPLETPDVARAIVVTPYMSRTLWRPYLPDLREPRAGGARVEEIAALGLATEGGYSAGRRRAADRRPPRRQ